MFTPSRIDWLAAIVVTASAIPLPVWAQTIPARMARGLIVELKPASATSSPGYLTAQAVHDRLTSVARAAGLPAPETSPRPVGTNGYMLSFDAPLQGAALDAAIQSVAADPSVQSVSPDVAMRRMNLIPNDHYFSIGYQWYLGSTSDSAGYAAVLNTPQAWGVTTGSNSPVVAVVDSGALFGHADLASQFIPGYDFISNVAAGNSGLGRNPDASDPGDWVSTADLSNPALTGCQVSDLSASSWHGSFIAGIIGAASNNSIGVAGIDWNTKILPVRVLGKCTAWGTDIIDGMRWAAGLPVAGVPNNPTPARVINISIGASDGEACSPAYQSAINEIVARGVLVVVAAGNEGTTALSNPANCAGVLAVGAVRQDGLKTFYSNFGAGVGLMAPGGADDNARPSDWIISTVNSGATVPVSDSYTQNAGTSFSAPMAAGVAALMLSVNPSLTPAQLISLLERSARPFPNNASYAACQGVTATACNCTAQTCGAGLLDANAAVQLALNNSSGSGGISSSSSSGSSGNSSSSSSAGNSTANSASNTGSVSQGGGGAAGWLWGLALWGFAVMALVQQRHLRRANKLFCK